MGRIERDMHGEPGPDARIAEVARRQWGVVTRCQLLAIGLGRGAVEHRLRVGRLHLLHQGVYAVGHTALRAEGRWLAAVLACGDGAALSHASAGAHLGLRRSASARIEVSAPRSRDGVAGVVVHRPRSLPASDIAEVDGIPTTTARRTLCDLRRVLSPAAHEQASAQAARMGLIAATDGPSAPQFTRSWLERRLLAVIRAAGLPAPEANPWLTLGGGEEWQVDLLWRRQRVIAEADSRAHHERAAAFEADRLRDQRLTAAGFRVVRFPHRQVTGDPASVVAVLSALLA